MSQVFAVGTLSASPKQGKARETSLSVWNPVKKGVTLRHRFAMVKGQISGCEDRKIYWIQRIWASDRHGRCSIRHQ